MSLPTTSRGSEISVYVPNEEAIAAAMECANGNPEVADYLVERFIIKMNNSGKAMVKNSQNMLQQLITFRDHVHLQAAPNGNPWAGIAPVSDFNNYQANLAQKAAQDLRAQRKQTLQVDFAISQQSALIRGFSSSGKTLDKNMESQVDNLLNSFFAKNGLVTKDSVIYEAQENGAIKQDEEGNPIKADPEQLRKLMADEKKGFKQFLANQEIDATVRGHEFPEEQQPAPQA